MLDNTDKNPKLPNWYTKTRINRSLFWVAIILLFCLLIWGISIVDKAISYPQEMYAIGFVFIVFFIFGKILTRFRINDISPNSPDEVYKRNRKFPFAHHLLFLISFLPSYKENKDLSEGTKIFGITFKNKDPL
jgi:uncharacterized membrane protein YhaH (DUF805 family)